MKYYELIVGEKTYKLRMTSSNAMALEKKTNRKLLDLVQDYSVNTIVSLLEYMCKYENSQFSVKEASSLYDELVDNDYTLEKIVFEVIYGALVQSGFLTKEELEEMIGAKKKVTEKLKQEVLEK